MTVLRFGAIWLLCMAHALCAAAAWREVASPGASERHFEIEEHRLIEIFSDKNPEFSVPSGTRFILERTDVIPHSLQSKFPSVQTWRGVAGQNKLNCEMAKGILRAQLVTPGGIYYLDPISTSNGVARFRYGKSLATKGPVNCAMEGIQPTSADNTKSVQSGAANSGIRIFRVAIAASGEYTQFHGSKEAAFAAIVTAINRVNGIYERELGIRFVLAENLDRVIYSDPATDPFSENAPTLRTIDQAQHTFDEQIGTENYDFGLVFNTGTYGLAYIRSVGDPQRKGSACVGLPEPTGDAFHVYLLAHEIGHQFGANHTFNTVEGICSGRRHEWAAYEPGSGSTIMSYASLPCGDDAFQAHHDDYFHSENLREINSFVQNLAAGTTEATTNRPPVVNAGLEYHIPTGTPFVLTATGFDPDGDELTYSWEQRDRGPAQTLAEPDNGLSPLFRSFYPTNSPSRYFPNLLQLLSGESSLAEKLPVLGRLMRFRVTARDGRGATAFGETLIEVTNTGAAFRVTSHTERTQLNGTATITWDAAGTTHPFFNAGQVKISMSLDGGYTFPYALAPSTSNDGSETVTLPDVGSSKVRFKVQPLNNIFFAINKADLQLGSPIITVSHFVSNRMFHLSWPVSPGFDYRVESTASPPAWELEECNILINESIARTVIPVTSSIQRFFRVRALAQN